MDQLIILPEYLEWSYDGVNASIPGNGGPDCAGFLSLKWRLCETVLACLMAAVYFSWGYSRITYPTSYPYVRKDRGGKRLLLVLVSLTFGIEIGFKLATRQLIYVLNPCHITVAIQIYLLAAPPNKHITTLFRIHLNYLNGAILAMLFPVTNARLLPFENVIYWVEHLMMLVTPYYLLRLGGLYNVEDFMDISWSVMSIGILIVYHFIPLQLIGLATQVNLNNMLCPAISDPFYGPYYRLVAVCHQSLCIPLISKAYCVLADFFITKFTPTKIKDHLEADVTMSSYDSLMSEPPWEGDQTVHTNGNLHRRSRSVTLPENGFKSK